MGEMIPQGGRLRFTGRNLLSPRNPSALAMLLIEKWPRSRPTRLCRRLIVGSFFPNASGGTIIRDSAGLPRGNVPHAMLYKHRHVKRVWTDRAILAHGDGT